jgi:hypothetical protein
MAATTTRLLKLLKQVWIHNPGHPWICGPHSCDSQPLRHDMTSRMRKAKRPQRRSLLPKARLNRVLAPAPI